MTLILTVIHLLVAFGIIFVVLVQKGSSADMGAAFGGSSQSLFGARGSGSFLGKVTAFLATVFMLTSLSLAFFTTRSTTTDSVMKGGAARPPQQQSPANSTSKAKDAKEGGIPAATGAPATDIPVPAKAQEPEKGKEGAGQQPESPVGNKPVPAFADSPITIPTPPKNATPPISVPASPTPSKKSDSASPTPSKSVPAQSTPSRSVPAKE
ncbi:MAG: preprotein translocase subunit SecG, partial [Magnetococcales bacterium]|nr:preprotein translocase subunit SecG [Magnetococcales bacterium]